MINIQTGINTITLIKNYNSIPTKIRLTHLLTQNIVELPCTSTGSTKVTVQFSYTSDYVGEFEYEIIDDDNNVISLGLAKIDKINEEIIMYNPDKQYKVYEG